MKKGQTVSDKDKKVQPEAKPEELVEEWLSAGSKALIIKTEKVIEELEESNKLLKKLFIF